MKNIVYVLILLFIATAIFGTRYLEKENKRLKIENSTKFTIQESMQIWSEGYKRAYERIDKFECPAIIDNDRFIIDSLIMLRKLESIYYKTKTND